MTKEVAEKIVRGITDKIECNTVDIDDWAEFWGFTRDEYEEFLDMAIKVLEQQPKTGRWLDKKTTIKGGHGLAYGRYGCSVCKKKQPSKTDFCPCCGADMRGEDNDNK